MKASKTMPMSQEEQ